MSIETCQRGHGAALTEELCSTCYGSGLDDESPDGDRSPLCEGVGYPELECYLCEGSGEVEAFANA